MDEERFRQFVALLRERKPAEILSVNVESVFESPHLLSVIATSDAGFTIQRITTDLIEAADSLEAVVDQLWRLLDRPPRA